MSDGMQKQLYGIAIFEEEILLSDFTGNGEKRFIVSPEQLMGFIRTEVTFRAFPGLIWMKTNGTCDTYLMTLPAATRTILYRKGKKLTNLKLKLPQIVVQVQIEQAKRKITGIHLWGMAGKELVADTVLYELPLPNLNGSNMCLGSTERAVTHDVRQAVEKTIFDTPFNHHAHIVGREKLPFHDYVRRHRNCCPFRTLNKIGIGRDALGGRI